MFSQNSQSGNGKAIIAGYAVGSPEATGTRSVISSLFLQKKMWTLVKLCISQSVKQGACFLSGKKMATPEALTQPSESSQKINMAGMTHNRLQALDGFGYRQCYMEKLRTVASELDPLELNRQYWFGKSANQTIDTKVAIQVEGELTQSGSKIPKIMETIPTRSLITSTQLQSYVETLPKRED